jgi:CRP/FNR family transcriptional regulator, cyclic AMP receptor protein
MRNKIADRSKMEALRGLRAFAACTDKELARIAATADQTVLAPGNVLMREGQPGRQTFVILGGEADVSIGGESLTTLGPGAFVGEMALLDNQPRSATVTAITPLDVLVFDPRAFGQLLESGRVARHVLAGLSERLREADRLPG